jgi:hypothetical protein
MLLRSHGRCICTCQGPVPYCRANLTRLCRRRQAGLPSSWRILMKACPGLGTPAAPGALALTVARMLPSVRLTTSASATNKDFGAVSTRPASSLSTLRTHQSPGEWQDSLLACPLRLWPGWTSTNWIPFERFRQLILTSSSPKLSLAR